MRRMLRLFLPLAVVAQAAGLDAFQAQLPEGEGRVEFEALMRKLDRVDRSYRN